MRARAPWEPACPEEATPMEPLLERLRHGAASWSINLSPSQLGEYRRYLELLLEWNQRFNLTAIEAPEQIIDKHFLDSLSCSLVFNLSPRLRLIDVGAGAGFPGLVLKIAFPGLEVLLLDALEKRLRFLDRVIAELRLTGISTRHTRAEDAGHNAELREQFDVATARAVSRLSTLAEYCLPFVRTGGSFLAQKGPRVADEVAEARSAFRILGAGEPSVRTLVLPGTDIGRSLVSVPKIAPTPRVYPRLAGTPKKHPL
jgi:16S rRNA (guanine527-N7)-methyltransferase